MGRIPYAIVCGALALLTAIGAQAGVPRQDAPNSPGAELTGRVVELTGTGVAGARVRALIAGRVVAEAVTGADGAFTMAVPRGVVVVTATAYEMAPASSRLVIPPSGELQPLQLVLGAALFSASVTVAAPAADAGGTEGSTSVVTAQAIGLLPARALDDVLAATPGFSLFRRASSRTANPTAQGVSLRGLGASGASRALVMADGFPANDPFGGWIYWNRLPMVAIDRVEVARGGRSERYGADAMGGVVSILTSPGGGPIDGRMLLQGGSRGTGKISAFGGVRRQALSAVASAEGGRSGRARIVSAEARGAVDTPAGSDHASGLVVVAWAPTPAFTASLRVNPFGERRANGTPVQRNDTRAAQVAATAAGAAGASQWEVRAWGQWTRFRQTFSTVSRDRTAETPGARQRVEAAAAGARARWDRAFGPAAVGVGVEVRQVEADNVEAPIGAPADAARVVGGRQRGPAVFARLSMPLQPRLRLDAGARLEAWRTRPSHVAGGDRGESSFSPRITLTCAPASALVAHAAAFRAFRAPTLNELYRGFRVGAITTLPNAALGPERLTGAEAGVGVTRHRVALRATAWWSRLEESVANVTVGALERQRQNVGAVAGRGFEAEMVLRPAIGLEWTGSLALTRSVFDDAVRPAIDGRAVPQVPRAQWSSKLRYSRSPLWAFVEVRRAGRQFEDDRNELPLRPSAVVDLAAGFRIHRYVEVSLSVENAANQEVEVGRTPLPTIGLPRSFHVGVRVDTR